VCTSEKGVGCVGRFGAQTRLRGVYGE